MKDFQLTLAIMIRLYFQRNDEGSILGFAFGKRISSGYAFRLNGQSPVACPIEERFPLIAMSFFGKGNGNSKCVGFEALALPSNPSSSSSSTSTSSTAAPSNALLK